MHLKQLSALAVVGALGAVAASAEAQQTEGVIEVGAEAPDFALTGATRYGLLQEPARLSDFKGKTVVLSFFYKARTRG
jgi:cytochrome oxidase Cu insertion factor (SCO1/SenC/PrrC family)